MFERYLRQCRVNLSFLFGWVLGFVGPSLAGDWWFHICFLVGCHMCFSCANERFLDCPASGYFVVISLLAYVELCE